MGRVPDGLDLKGASRDAGGQDEGVNEDLDLLIAPTMTFTNVRVGKHPPQVLEDGKGDEQLEQAFPPGREDLGGMTLGHDGSANELANIENSFHRKKTLPAVLGKS